MKWALRLALGIFSVIAISQIVPYLTELLRALVFLYTITNNSTPEFKMILLIFSLWVTCEVINTVTNIIFKVYGLINNKRKRR